MFSSNEEYRGFENGGEMSKTLPPTNINYEMIAEFQRIMNETKQVIEKEKENTQVEDAKSKLIERQNAINFIKELKLNFTSFKPGQERREYENGGETSNYFSDGGDVNPPIFTSNRNDPRLQSYNDSLSLFNAQKVLGGKSSEWLKNVPKNSKGMVSEIEWQKRYNTVKNVDKKILDAQWDAFGRLTKTNKKEPGTKYHFKQELSGLPNGFDTYVTDFDKPVQPIVYKSKPKVTPKPTSTVVPTTTTSTPTTTPIKTTPAPKVERKVVSVTPEEVKAGTKTTSGKQIGSGTAGGRIYKVSYDNGETEILNEYEYRSRGLKMENGGEIKKYKFKTKQK
jgi:hypothetical protein